MTSIAAKPDDERHNRMVRLYRFLKGADGAYKSRDEIMQVCGFSKFPVTGYVEFENTLIRLNGRLRKIGQKIVRASPDGTPFFEVVEQYKLEGASA